jgi:hypothetical protein
VNRQDSHGGPRIAGAIMALSGGTGWKVVGPLPVEATHLPAAVSVASPTEVWVAGHAGQRPLIARWDGSSWWTPPSPPPEPNHLGAGFQGVDASPDHRAIAVGGAYDRVAGTDVPLLQHWDGSAWTSWDGWSDSELARGYVLTDVAMVGDEAWAVGHGPVRGGPVALRWSERQWRPAGMPLVQRGKLLAVSGTAADDVWAVGAADRTGMIMHFDGRDWSRVPAPSTRFPLSDVVALSPSDAWAVGRDRVLHWNGRKWNKVKAPVTAANTVTALAADDVWVAGGRGELVHFDGDRWTPAASPPGDTAVWLASAALPHRERPTAWMVGSYQATRAGTIGGAPSITVRSTDP